MKTHSGAKKRFKLTAKGKVRARHAFTSHILEKKSPKHKRALARPVAVSPDDTPRVKRLLGAGAGRGSGSAAARKRAGNAPARGDA
jgi:large subunit ribosomal protein L35